MAAHHRGLPEAFHQDDALVLVGTLAELILSMRTSRTRSVTVVDSGEKSLLVGSDRCWPAQLLHFAAALLRCSNNEMEISALVDLGPRLVPVAIRAPGSG